ncbi:L-2-amino-thiazoline-4-carboxylic acid hydrolase (plasmid) [Streptomyces sp. NBC_00335]|uniref:L-2-amino-thiazoline-4-carboxylic acid hydrolase n=1 Tax=unclassified Streptomyces TaxID=2593676 RepID=UPI0022581AD0|nr:MULTISPECIES: L-2-amino-thiazoline-4-carboxylic acid hydrolase [unclassified Streptomyces]MCX5410039.1 L-2-amino-thiazoline-4-carboxylic acid hydrolase [Streptomyces sp. NBC_00086]
MTPSASPAPVPAGPGEPSADLLRQFWWLHDARWYQGVARRFGQDAANEVNAEAMQFVTRRIASAYAREEGLAPGLSAAELAGALTGISELMTGDAVEASNKVTGEESFETAVTRNFALEMLARAGTLEGYECPCPQMRAGWFEGLKTEVSDHRVECLRTGGSACRFRTSTASGATAAATATTTTTTTTAAPTTAAPGQETP